MGSVKGQPGSVSRRPVSALPSVRARSLAFAAILVAGLCGGLIGFSTVKVGCHGSCGTPEGVGGLTGAVVAAVGVAVIAVLVLRAMGEWRTITEKRQIEQMMAAGTNASAADDPIENTPSAGSAASPGNAANTEAGHNGDSPDLGGPLGATDG